MLLTETIDKSISTIKKRAAAKQQKDYAVEYTAALVSLSQAAVEVKSALICAGAIDKSGLAEHSVLSISQKSELMDSIDACGAAAYESTLSAHLVKVLQMQGKTLKSQETAIWREAAAKYVEGPNGYLSMLGGLSENPADVENLKSRINSLVAAEPSAKNVEKLLAEVERANVLISQFTLSPEVEAFLRKVSSKQATFLDLTPNILCWLRDRNLMNKLRISF